MKKAQIENYDCKLYIREWLQRTIATWANNPKAVKVVESYDIEMIPLVETRQAEQEGTKPATKGKNARKQKINKQVLCIGGVLCTIATDIGDEELKALATLAPSKHGKKADSDFADIGWLLLAKARAIDEFIRAQYGLDDAELNDFQAFLEENMPGLRKPRFTAGELMAMRKLVPGRLRKLGFIVEKQLRNVFAPYQDTNPKFWEEFEACTRIINNRGRKKTGNPTGDNPDNA